MRRARIAVAFLTLTLGLCASGTGRALTVDTKLSSVGILDYTSAPRFKVGDYVRYLVTTVDEPGSASESYYLTVLIAGEELFWGDRCFWVETWTDGAGRPISYALTLMSYDIFRDSLAEDHIMDYQRKLSSSVNEDDGKLIETVVAPKAASLTFRSSQAEPTAGPMDTTGVDTTVTPAGTFRCRVAVRHSAYDKTGSSGDSTVYKKRIEDHTIWVADGIPLTRSVRDEVSSRETRRAWLIGRSKEGTPERITNTRVVSSRLVEFGHGLKPRLLPLDRARSFDDAPTGTRTAPRPQPRGTAGGAARR